MTIKPRGFASRGLFTAAAAFLLAASQAHGAIADSKTARTDKQAQLIRVLRSNAARQDKALACKQLALCGTRQAVPALAALLSDGQLASWARIALEAIPGPAADTALRKAMAQLHGSLLVGTINSIGVRRDTKAVAGLINWLDDGDTEVASAAAVALGRIGGAKAGQALEQALAGTPAAVRPAAAEACVLCAEGLLTRGKSVEALRLYDAVRAADVPKQNRLEATRGAILARRAGGLPLLLEQLRSPDKACFGIGLRTARELTGQQVTEALVAELNRCEPDRQALLLLAVGARQDAAVLPVIRKAAQSGPDRLRLTAVGVLDHLGDASSMAVLLDAAESDNADLAQAALGALARLPGDDVDADLLARLQRATGKTCRVLIELAAQRRIQRALPILLRCAEQGDPAIRSAAVQAMGVLGDHKQAAELVRLVEKTANPKERADIEAALVAISSRNGAACAPLVLPLARSDDSGSRTMAMHVLASIGGREALAAVMPALEDKDEAVQDEAVRILSTWPNNWPEDTNVAEPLLGLAKSGQRTSHRVLGLRGYLHCVQGDKQLKDDEKVSRVKEILPLMKRPEEQRMAIAILGTVPSAGALELLITLAAEPAVADDACSAVVAFAQKKIPALSQEQWQKALQMVVEKSTSAGTKKAAQENLRKLPGHRPDNL